jgi:calcineurin-like phosphoesterase family protein
MKTWFTSGLNFGSHDLFFGQFSPRQGLDYAPIIVNKINNLVAKTDILIIVGDIIDTPESAGWLSSIVCSNIFVIPSEKDNRNSLYIKPFVTFLEDGVMVETGKQKNIICYYNELDCYDMCHNNDSFVGVCGSPFNEWLYKENTVNVTVDLWRYAPIEMNNLLKFMENKK